MYVQQALFQGVVHQMRDAIDRTIGVIDESMAIIACTVIWDGLGTLRIRQRRILFRAGYVCEKRLHV